MGGGYIYEWPNFCCDGLRDDETEPMVAWEKACEGVLIKCCIKSNALVTTISYPLQLSSVVKPFDYNLALSSRLVYICSSLFQLTVESCNLS